ncbi:hypothetical protein CTAYLR_001665 [Chrysophaeum taylorii]|uniref:G domain-containing protein n=1 Tax=Chrysophaeum taylorii TaxID=2483200 RepID=A0AAD7XKX1_9STRA|nr:hypothetical protein CTAYLR_001665 [Chrysophaeum taylorii]
MDEEVGELVARCHEARAEGSAVEIVSSVQQLRGAASLVCDAAVVEVVASCVKGAEEKVAELIEASVIGGEGVEETCMCFVALRGDLDRGGAALARGSRVACRRKMREAASRSASEACPRATVLANVLGACCGVATVALRGEALGKELALAAARDAVDLGSEEARIIANDLLREARPTDVLSMDARLDELSFACQFGRRFERFAGSLEIATPEISTRLGELDGAYVELEGAYCDACVRAALEDDDKEGLGDVFFVLRRGVDRALSTLSEQAALARLHGTLATLSPSENVYRTVARVRRERASSSSSSNFATALVAAMDEDEHGASPAALAAASRRGFECSSAVEALASDVVAQLATSVPAALPLVDDFKDAARVYEDLATGALDALFEAPEFQEARARFRNEAPLADIAATDVLLDSKLAPLYENTVLAHPVFRTAADSLTRGRPRTALCRLLARDAAGIVLDGLLATTFTALGALALRREVRGLQALIASYLPGEGEEEEEEEGGNGGNDDRDTGAAASVRGDFDLLSTALDLLNLEAPGDARLLLQTTTIVVANNNNTTTTLDVATILRRRVDFSPTAIEALTGPLPRTTRDARVAAARLGGLRFHIADTAGYEVSDDDDHVVVNIDGDGHNKYGSNWSGMSASMLARSRSIVQKASVVLLLLGREVAGSDFEASDWLRPLGKPRIVAFNKCEHARPSLDDIDTVATRFLGKNDFEEPLFMSATHGDGLPDLLAALRALGAPEEEEEDPPPDLRIALVGRPNVGKSSLLNALSKELAALTSPVPGVTRDPVEARVTFKGKTALVVDTAGLRRRHQETLDALRATDRELRYNANATALVVDASEPTRTDDARLARRCLDTARGAFFVVANKADVVRSTHIEAGIAKALGLPPAVPVVACSATAPVPNTHPHRLLAAAFRADAAHRRKWVKTPVLNAWLRDWLKSPLGKPAVLTKVRFIAQTSVDPPTFALHGRRLSARLTPAAFQALRARVAQDLDFFGARLRFVCKNTATPWLGLSNRRRRRRRRRRSDKTPPTG